MSRPFANLDGLVRLSHKEGVDVRRPLLRVLTDLYVQESNHTREEEQQYVELALRLLPDVDTTTRMVVARKLKAYGQAPSAVLEAIKHSTPEAAALIADTPASSASSKPANSASAPTATEIGARADQTALRGTKPPMTPEGSGEGFLQMTAAERSNLLEDLYRPSDAEPVEEMSLVPRPGARKRLEKAALMRNRNEFARELQLSLGITSRVASRIANDESGELIIVAAKALDMRVEMLVRILLIMNPTIGESVERVFTLTWLYQRLLPESVMPIVSGWQDEVSSRSAARFRSVHADDEAEAARLRDLGRGSREDQSRVRRSGTDAPMRRQDAS